MTRDKVTDDRRHSVYRGKVLSTVLGSREKKHTLCIEEDGVLPEMWPLKYAP